jgi:protein required for attachment to host cells
MITLILVANGTEARLLSATQRVNPRDLQEVAHLTRATVAARSRAASDNDPHTVEIERFARRIARRLDAVRRTVGYDDLVVIAAPRFLGTLRTALRGVTRDLVSREVPRDLVRAEDRQIKAVAFE